MSDTIGIDMETAPSPEFPVTVDAGAIIHLQRLLKRRGGTVLRLGVSGGGCSGLEYLVRAEESPRETDLVQEIQDLTVVCDPKSAKFLQGTVLSWNGNLMTGGFVFENPNAARSCGCGTSFFPK